jgi:hypothetical protein
MSDPPMMTILFAVMDGSAKAWRPGYGGKTFFTLPSELTCMKPVPAAMECIDSSRPPPSAPDTIR